MYINHCRAHKADLQTSAAPGDEMECSLAPFLGGRCLFAEVIGFPELCVVLMDQNIARHCMYVLVSTGTELIFLVVSGMMLCFGFGKKTSILVIDE